MNLNLLRLKRKLNSDLPLSVCMPQLLAHPLLFFKRKFVAAKSHNRADFSHSVTNGVNEDKWLLPWLLGYVDRKRERERDSLRSKRLKDTLNRAKRSKTPGRGLSWTVWHQSMEIITKQIEDIIGSNEMRKLCVIENLWV